MCIANTSTAALMVPIVLSVLDELHKGEEMQAEMEHIQAKHDTNVVVNVNAGLIEPEKKDSRHDEGRVVLYFQPNEGFV